MAAAPPPGSLGLVDRVLTYVDKPWKIASIAALAVIAIISVTCWEKRAEIAEAVLHATVVPRLEPSRFKAVMTPVMNETGADMALLLQIQLSNNVARIVAGRRRGDPNWVPPSGPRPIFGAANPDVIVHLLEGAADCGDVTADSPSQTGRDIAALGITRSCLIAVPPVVDVLVGALGIGWHKPPSPQAEAGAKAVLRRAAGKLATW